MSAETFTPYPHGAAEFSARPKVETRRGTEVRSGHGDRLLRMANRIASLMDRVKGGRTEVVETAQDRLEQGRQFMKATGEKAVNIATTTLNVIGSTALVGLEFGVGAAVLGAEATVRGAKRAKEVASNGLDTANNWIEDKITAVDDALVGGATKAGEWVTDKVDAVRTKGTELREAATGKYAEVRSFFHNRAETAQLKMEKMRRNWVAGYSRTRRGALNTFESGKAFAAETGENIVHNGRALRKAGQLAIAQYRTDAVPVMPR